MKHFHSAGAARILLGTSLATLAAASAWAQEGPALPPPDEAPASSRTATQSTADETSRRGEPIPGTAGSERAAGNEAEIVVTGSRIARTGFAAPTPVTVVGTERLQALGLTSVGEALNQIPGFRASANPQVVNTVQAGTVPGGAVVDLRGLGVVRTLALVDGRRFLPSTTSGTVDLSNIPQLLVDRVEVVTGGVSAQYGSDAVAGVVNLILDTRMEGLRGQANGGISQEGDGAEYQFSLAGGTPFAGGRGRFIAGAEFRKVEPIYSIYSRDWGAVESQLVTNPQPGNVVRNGVPGNGEAANIIDVGVHTGLGTPQGLIVACGAANRACGAAWTTFTDAGQPIPFVPGRYGPGVFLDVGGTGEGQNGFLEASALLYGTQRYNGFAHVEYDLTEDIMLFAEGSYAHADFDMRGLQPRNLGNVTLPTDYAFLPADLKATLIGTGPTFTFGKMFNEAYPFTHSDTDLWRGVVGLEGSVGEWTWNAYYQHGRNEISSQIENDLVTANYQRAIDATLDASGQPVCRVNIDTNPVNDDPACVPYNLIGSFQASSQAQDYVTATASARTVFTQDIAEATVQRSLFALPGGDAKAALGASYRRDEAVNTADPISAAGGFFSNAGSNISGTIEVKEAFAELVLPILEDVPGADYLEVTGAGRYTDYSTTGGTWTWKVGATWQPFDLLRLRATRSRDIRAPNTQELFAPRTNGFATILDPLSNRQTLATQILGGNPDLTNEEADTLTVGAVVSPQGEWLGGLRLSVDYYRIEIGNVISTLGAQNIANRCAAGATDICGLIVRNPDGSVNTVFNVSYNLNELFTEGLDIEASYQLPLDRLAPSLPGSLNFRVLATHVAHLTTTDVVGPIDRAGMTGFPISQVSGVPKWQLDGVVGYSDELFALNMQVRWIQSGKYDVTLVGPDDPRYEPFLSDPANVGKTINDNTVPGRVYFNLAAQYNILRGENDRNLQVFGSINNLFDRDPPLAPGANGMNPVYFDQLGRYFRAGFRFRY